MSKPIDTLMSEHRVIEGALDSLESFAKRVDKGTEEDRRSAKQFGKFFRMFADKCHHGKEEDLLFKELVTLGMAPDGGPIGVMLEEHELGRSCVRRISALGDGDGPWTSQELDDFHSAVSEFVPLLRAHIQKEDGILFPAADRLLPSDRVNDLDRRFELFDRDQIGEDVHEDLLKLARSLSDQWGA